MLEKLKNLSRKQITIIVGVLLLMNVLGFLIYDPYRLDLGWLNFLAAGLQNIGFIVRVGIMNYLNLSFVGFMFLGYILYVLTKGREMRLLRFALSLIILTNAVGLLNIFGSLYVCFARDVDFTLYYWFDFLFFVFRSGIYLLLGWCLLASLKKNRELEKLAENDLSDYNAIGIGDHVYVAASKWLRFANLCLDLIFSLLILFYFFYVLENYLQIRIGSLSPWFTPLALIARFLYYLFFETVLGTTPAKYLTETRVVPLYGVETIEEGQDKPGRLAILKRTLSRFFPFEPIFFLCGKPLHDNWSDTEVIREERTGVKGRVYIYALVVMSFLVGVGMYGISEYKERVKDELYAIDRHNAKMALMKRIALLDKGDYIELKDEDVYRKYIYVILDVKEDSLICAQFALASQHITEIDASFQNLGGLDTDIFDDESMSISRYKLLNSVKVEDYSNEPIMLGEDEKTFLLEDVYLRGESRVDKNISSSSVSTPYGEENSSYNFSFQNKGWPIHVLTTSVIEGKLDLEVDGRGTVLSIYGYGNSKKNKIIRAVVVARNNRGELEKYLFNYDGADVVEFKKLE